MAVVTDKMLTPQELAATYAVPAGWVYTHVRLRTIPHYKLGHYVRFDTDEIEAWLQQQRRGVGRVGLVSSSAKD